MSNINFLALILLFALHNQSNSIIIKPKDFDFRISYVHKLIRIQNWNCTDIVNYFIERSIKYNARLNAIISFNPRALDQALLLDNLYKKTGTFKGKLHCVPFVIKDNIDVVGMPTTGGIKALRNSFPNKDSLVVGRLIAEGAIIISKANLGELAWGIDQSEMGGQCKNPYDARRSCGPSSIGSGAAIGSSLGIVALGTDTDGSIIVPGSYNSIFALRYYFFVMIYLN
jgi:amidase